MDTDRVVEVTGIWVIVDDPMVGNTIRILVDLPDGLTKEILVDKTSGPGPIVVRRSMTWIDRAPIVRPPTL